MDYNVLLLIGKHTYDGGLEKVNKLYIHCGTLIDGHGNIKKDSTLVVENGRIKNIISGKSSEKDAHFIDAGDKYVMPGLIDMHGHFYGRASKEMKSQHGGYSLLYLAGGITTVRAPGEYEPEVTLQWKKDIEEKRKRGPRIISAGSYFDREPSIVTWIEGSSSIEEIRKKFQDWKDKIDFVKVYSNIPPTWLKEIVTLAENKGLKVYGHLGMTDTETAIKFGIRGLEHGIYTMTDFREPDPFTNNDLLMKFDPYGEEAKNILKLIKAYDVSLIPTTVIFTCSTKDFKKRVDENNLWRYLSVEAEENHRHLMEKDYKTDHDHRQEKRLLTKQYAFLKQAYDLGIRIFCGTDPSHPLATPGYAIVWEAEHMVKSGLKHEDIIKSLTIEAAKELGIEKITGSIDIGKEADLFILEKNPLEDITNLSFSYKVIKSGIVYDPNKLRDEAIGSLR